MLRRLALLTVVGALLLGRDAVACPACFGAASGPTIDGMNAAILAMLGITGTVFGGIVVFAIFMRRRTRVIFDRTPGTAYLNEHGILQWKNS